MSTHDDNRDPPDHDEKVGYGNPPKYRQFQKGQSGNPKGRPRKKHVDTVDISAVLEEPLRVATAGGERQMSPFEVGTRALAKRALEGDLNAMICFIQLCEEYQVISPPPPVKSHPNTRYRGIPPSWG